MKVIGKNINTSDVAFHDTISVNSTTAVTLLAALAPDQQIWSEVTITNNGNKSLWVRKRPAAADNTPNGVRIAPGESRCVIKDSEVYVGEVSGIFEGGGFRDVFVEYF